MTTAVGWCIYKPRTTHDCQQPTRSHRGDSPSQPHPGRRNQPCPHLELTHLASRTVRFSCFSHPSVWYFVTAASGNEFNKFVASSSLKQLCMFIYKCSSWWLESILKEMLWLVLFCISKHGSNQTQSRAKWNCFWGRHNSKKLSKVFWNWRHITKLYATSVLSIWHYSWLSR